MCARLSQIHTLVNFLLIPLFTFSSCIAAIASDEDDSKQFIQNGMKLESIGKYREASNAFEKAAELGNSYGQYLLGTVYEKGKGVPIDLTQAGNWYEKAAKQGQADAQYTLGAMYITGRGVPKDEKKAAEWYEKAARQGSVKAQNNLGSMYDTGRGVPKDEKRAAEWYEKAAQQGNVGAQNSLGSMYDTGRGVPKDDRKAAEWYEKAAQQGNAGAQNNLGSMYDAGRGVPQDDRKAAEWYEKAAQQGSATAQYNLGTMYDTGRGVPKDDRKAAKWYEKAAHQGIATAQYNLGFMYENERGVPKDEKKAAEWFERAAAQGSPLAKLEATRLREKLYKQTKEPPVEAVNYYQKYDERSCGNGQSKNLMNTIKELNADQQFIPNTLNQENFGICYGMSAAYLLQYLVNKASGKIRNLNEIEVLGQGCNSRLRPWGWQTDYVLHNFRIENQGYFTDASPHVNYKELLGHMNEVSKLYCEKKSNECCKLFIDKILTKDASNLINRDFSQIKEVIEKEMGDQKTEKDTFSYRLIDRLNPNKKTSFPKYNVFSVKFKSTVEAQTEIKKLFQSKDRFPINLNICVKSEDNSCKKDGFHAITISGVKEVCCQNKCHDEWNIVNSYGSNSAEQGWHLATPLAESLTKFNMYISYIRPCSEDSANSEAKCKPYIQGTDPVFRMAGAGDLEGMKSLLEAMPELRKQLTANSGGKNPIYAAISSGKEDMVKFILQQPGFDLAHDHGTWPVFMAAQTGELKILRLLLDHKAPFQGPAGDKQETALHRAAESGNPDVIQLLIDRKLPINAQDKKGDTPLARAIEKATSNSPIDLYYRKLHTESVRILLRGGADLSIHGSGTQDLKKIIENSNNTELKKVLDQHINLKTTND